MMKKVSIFLILLAFIICLISGMASAQSTSNCIGTGTGYPGPSYPGTFNCVYVTYTFGWTCNFWLPACPPVAGPTETRCPECEGKAGKPISLADGNTYISQTDVRVPGLSNGLILSRTWNSLWPSTQTASQVGLFGPNWRSTYEERVFVGSDNYIKYARSDGSFWSFASGSVAAPANVTASLSLDSTLTQWTLVFQNGEQRIFDYASGWLTKIIDRNGNITLLTYDATNRLITVTDPGGRHLYFGYASTTSRLITSVTSDIGISLSYAYDPQGRLIQITKPDLTIISFTFDANSLITAVTDNAGKVLESHTYDTRGRGLTSSRAGGVDAVTVTYP